MNAQAKMLGNGVYTVSEAARLTGLSTGRVREWFRGRASRAPAVFQSDYPSVAGQYVISFHDLLELFIGGRLRNEGVSLQRLRKVHRKLQRDLNTKHPFSKKQLLFTDAKRIFTAGLDAEGREEIIEVLTHQSFFAKIIKPFLKSIDYDQVTEEAKRWLPAELIAIDPSICFGKPIVAPVGISTSILAAAYHANNRNAQLVAEWYEIEARHVMAAVAYEAHLAA